MANMLSAAAGSLPVQPLRTSGRQWIAKRCLDIVVASLALIVLSPVMLAAAVLVRLSSSGPILFRQTRVGEGERRFTILKFRTMYADADDRLHRDFNRRELLGDPGMLIEDGIYKPQHDPRLTPVGAVLRRYSIDELPQLLNVLRGTCRSSAPGPPCPGRSSCSRPSSAAAMVAGRASRACGR